MTNEERLTLHNTAPRLHAAGLRPKLLNRALLVKRLKKVKHPSGPTRWFRLDADGALVAGAGAAPEATDSPRPAKKAKVEPPVTPTKPAAPAIAV